MIHVDLIGIKVDALGFVTFFFFHWGTAAD